MLCIFWEVMGQAETLRPLIGSLPLRSRCWTNCGPSWSPRSEPSATSTTCAPSGSWRGTTRMRWPPSPFSPGGPASCWTSWVTTPAGWTSWSSPSSCPAARASSSPRSRTRSRRPRTRRSRRWKVTLESRLVVAAGLFTPSGMTQKQRFKSSQLQAQLQGR